eukprot:XP_001690205.1 predicted protein [Chlamydomonas reinhardtii]
MLCRSCVPWPKSLLLCAGHWLLAPLLQARQEQLCRRYLGRGGGLLRPGLYRMQRDGGGAGGGSCLESCARVRAARRAAGIACTCVCIQVCIRGCCSVRWSCGTVADAFVP